MKLSRVLNLARKLSRAEFLEQFPHPAFLVRPHAELEETTLLRTLRPVDNDDLGEFTGFSVEAIVKRTGAAGFPSLVTLGRAPGNDLRFSAPGVSKYHAYVRVDETPYSIVDAGSTYGTVHNSRKLKARVDPAPLLSGDDVILGDSVGMLFLKSEALYDHLRALLRDSDTPSRRG